MCKQQKSRVLLTSSEHHSPKLQTLIQFLNIFKKMIHESIFFPSRHFPSLCFHFELQIKQSDYYFCVVLVIIGLVVRLHRHLLVIFQNAY